MVVGVPYPQFFREFPHPTSIIDLYPALLRVMVRYCGRGVYGGEIARD